MASLSKINHKGKEIFYIDYTELNETQMIELLKKAESIILKEKKPKLFLVNITETFVSQEFIRTAIDISEKVKHLSQKSTIVGLTEADNVLLRGFNAIISGKMKAFDTKEEAMEYLIK